MGYNNDSFAPVLKIRDGRVEVTAPSGTEAEFLGADFPQLVDDKLVIHSPLTDMTATLSFVVKSGENRREVDVPLLIRGEHGRASGAKPRVIPEPAQWYSAGGGNVTVDDIAEISYSHNSLARCAEGFTADFNRLFDCQKIARLADKPKKGCIFFEKSDSVSHLGEEGYTILAREDGLHITVSAERGAIWAGKTVLQLFGQSGFPCGEMRDYPRYPVRGFMLDAGRRPMTIPMLKRFVERMAWYKLNDFQIHLSDNYIWLEDYAQSGDDSTFEAYEAFRLESSLKNDRGETFTAKDFSYTKAEFRRLIDWAAERGVKIIPELDVPAHALALTKAFPEYTVRDKRSSLAGNRPLTDHLDISRPETVDFIKRVFDDYTGGENPTFSSDVTVHIGADEFLTDYGAYRRFINELVPYIKKTNTVRMWGGLTWIKDDPPTEIAPEAIDGVEVNLWSSDWADGREMYDMGYRLINTIDSYLYMVPNGTEKRGAYTDLLNKKRIFKEFYPSRVKTKNNGKYIDLPAGERRMLGAVYAIWHDNIDKKASGLTQTDTFDRFLDCAPLMAEKTWGSCTDKRSAREIDEAAAAIGAEYKENKAAGSIDLDSLTLCGAKLKNGALDISGGYAENSFDCLPVNTEITVDIELNEAKAGQIIMESDGIFGAAYDLRITDNGKLGFSREGYEYEFDYIPPVNRRVRLKISAKPLCTTLRVGLFTRKKARGSFIHNGTVRRSGIKNSTLQIPCARLGSKTNSAKAKIYGITFKSI